MSPQGGPPLVPDGNPAALLSPPAVSIVVPCFNIHGYLEECLRSVVAQDFADWEAIVVDDCSTDADPAEVVQSFADPRIHLLRHSQNRGLAAARNTGFEAARSKLVLPLDGDDLLLPTFLSRLLSVLRDRDLDCAFADFELFGAQTRIRRMQVEELSVFTRYQWLPGAGVLMKRDLWLRAGKYREDQVLRLGNEDWDFWLHAAEAGFRAGHIAEPLYRYRQHAQNMSQGLSANDHLTRTFLLERHRTFFHQHGGARHFLASGYWQSAEVARRNRQVGRSLALGTRALFLDRDWRRAHRLAQNNFSMLLPDPLRRILQSAVRPLPQPPRSSLSPCPNDAASEKI